MRWYAEGEAAQRLVDLAQRQGLRIETQQASELLLALRNVKLNTRIPRELYLAVARIYAYILSEEGKKHDG